MEMGASSQNQWKEGGSMEEGGEGITFKMSIHKISKKYKIIKKEKIMDSKITSVFEVQNILILYLVLQ